MLFNSLGALLVLIPLAVAAPLSPQIRSFNICYAATSFETNDVSQPHSIFHLSAINVNGTLGASTVFGLHEAPENQLTDLLKGLGSEWIHTGVARDNEAKPGDTSQDLYRSAVLDVVYRETK